MQVIVVASQKGGAGKTTLAAHLAVQAERAGAGPVVMIDTDRQGSLSAWWNSRKADAPQFLSTTFPRLMTDLEAVAANGIKLVIIDTPPAITMAIRDVIMYANLVVVPTRPSPHDLRAVAATVDIVESARKPILFVINGAAKKAKITADAALALSQYGTVSPVMVHQRIDFATSMVDGGTVMEADPGCASAREIVDLWTYVEGRLKRTQGVWSKVGRLLAAGG